MTETITYQTDTSDMHIPHNMFRAAFREMPALVTGVAAEDTQRSALVGSYVDNVVRFLDAHHGGEDELVWPLLVQRCPPEANLVARMEQQHAAVHQLRDRVDGVLETWTQTAEPVPGRELAEALESLRDQLEVHLGEEERDILPLASRNISAEEWGALPGHAMAHFTGDKIWLILGLVLEQMTDEQRKSTLALLPPPAVEMWTTEGNAAFDEFITAVRQR